MTGLSRRRKRLSWLIGAAAVLALLVVGLIGIATGWFRPGAPPVVQNLDTVPTDERKVSQTAGDAEKPKQVDNPNVLTVSRNKKDGGRYQSISAALEAVRPGQTIRILDRSVYAEHLRINLPSLHRGITLESVQGATLEPRMERGGALLLEGIPDVTLRGLTFRVANGTRCTLLAIHGHCPGLRVEESTFVSEVPQQFTEAFNNAIEIHSGSLEAVESAPHVDSRLQLPETRVSYWRLWRFTKRRDYQGSSSR